jgi:hypothetical protein
LPQPTATTNQTTHTTHQYHHSTHSKKLSALLQNSHIQNQNSVTSGSKYHQKQQNTTWGGMIIRGHQYDLNAALKAEGGTAL